MSGERLGLGEIPSEDSRSGLPLVSWQTGRVMLTLGYASIAVMLCWDWIGAVPASKASYSLIGLWLMLGFGVQVAEVVYA